MYTEFITTLSHIVEETVFNYQDIDTQTQTLLDLLEVDFKTEIATQFQTFFEQPDHFLEFIERNDSINGMIDHIISYYCRSYQIIHSLLTETRSSSQIG